MKIIIHSLNADRTQNSLVRTKRPISELGRDRFCNVLAMAFINDTLAENFIGGRIDDTVPDRLCVT